MKLLTSLITKGQNSDVESINDFFYLHVTDISILSKLLTKLKPENTWIQPENYEMGFFPIITLDDSADDIINITDHEQVSFCQTSNMNNTLHQDNQYTGKVSKSKINFNYNINVRG